MNILEKKLSDELGINHAFLFPAINKLTADFKSEFKYPTNLEVSPQGDYWKNRERAVKYTKLSEGLQQIDGQPVFFKPRK